MKTFNRTLSASMILVALCGSAAALAEPPAATPAPAVAPAKADLPSAASVFDKYIEATGGKAAYDKITSRSGKGSLEMSPMGIKATMSITQSSPNRFYVETDIAGMGTMKQGFDGTTAWESNPTTGTRILDGEEKDGFVRRTSFNAELDMLKNYPKSEVVGSETMESQDCWKVKLPGESGEPQFNYYSKSSGLLIVTVMKQQSQMGEIEIVSAYSDYRDVDGIKIPFKTVIKPTGMPMTQTLTFDSMQHNIKIDEKTFALPQEVLDLMKKDKGDKPAAPAHAPEGKP